MAEYRLLKLHTAHQNLVDSKFMLTVIFSFLDIIYKAITPSYLANTSLSRLLNQIMTLSHCFLPSKQ